MPGDGGIDFAAVLGALKQTGYAGWRVVEAERRRRDRQPEGLRDLEANHELELGRLLSGLIALCTQLLTASIRAPCQGSEMWASVYSMTSSACRFLRLGGGQR